MGWIRGIRQVSIVHVPLQLDRRGPVMTRPMRRIVDLPIDQIARIVQGRHWVLPLDTGAGPCGTLARHASGGSYSTWWSVRRLLAPLRAYYATYVPPMHFGAKTGPRGRNAA